MGLKEEIEALIKEGGGYDILDGDSPDSPFRAPVGWTTKKAEAWMQKAKALLFDLQHVVDDSIESVSAGEDWISYPEVDDDEPEKGRDPFGAPQGENEWLDDEPEKGRDPFGAPQGENEWLDDEWDQYFDEFDTSDEVSSSEESKGEEPLFKILDPLPEDWDDDDPWGFDECWLG